ncbi:hypothetical protein GCM10022226_16980 [Sphaerisporangium flaviroseum]|uniref:Uncharacterized protein n=1 Tax=Sphaerisporangium flaviroseum TaxID=509199 RepID=A0ABP7HRQ6_9ACTN
MMDAMVSRLPRPVCPATVYPATRSAVQPPISTAAWDVALPRMASIVATAPARSAAAEDGTMAVQYPDNMKYTSQAVLLRLVSVAHDHETPAVSCVTRSLIICGRY